MKKIISILAVAAAVLTACNGNKITPEPEGGNHAEIALSQESILAGPEGGSYSVTVTSSEPWRIAGFCEWATLSAEEGKSGESFTVNVTPNEGRETRQAVLKVFAGDAVKTLTIASTPEMSAILLSEEEISLSADAHNLVITMNTNIPELDVEGENEWIEVTKMEDALGKRMIHVSVKRSQDFKAREGQLSFGTGGMVPVQVSISQAQRDTVFAVEGTKLVKGLEAMDETLTLKSNIDYTCQYPSWLSEKSATPDSELDPETGLKTRTVTVHADACLGTRAGYLEFKKDSGTCGSVYVRQQNPNPVYAPIKDETLAGKLESAGLIIKDPDTGKCEIVEAGMTVSSITVGVMGNSYQLYNESSIEGLEAFPALKVLNVGNCQVDKVDVSAFPAIEEVHMTNIRNLELVNFGDKDITKVDCKYGAYGYDIASAIEFKGSKITEIDFSASGYYMSSERLESIDVTGCPALTKLNCNRKASWGSSNSPVKYIYMTAAQAESVQVTKLATTEIVIK